MQASTKERGSCWRKRAFPVARASVVSESMWKEEIDGCVVAGVGREAVERCRENVVEGLSYR